MRSLQYMRATMANASTELSLTVPITNSLAFLFTVLGEWWAEGKVINRGQSQSTSFSSQIVLTGFRYMGWHDFGLRRHRPLCAFQELGYLRTYMYCKAGTLL